MRKVKAWLVTEITDWAGVFVERPVAAFQNREMAERCKETRDRRAEGAEDRTWHEVYEIEVVLMISDEERCEVRKAFEVSDGAHIGVMIPDDLVDLIRDYIVGLLKDNDSRLTAVNWTLNSTWSDDGKQVICHFPEQRDANYFKRETLKDLSDDKSNIQIRLVNFTDETDRDAVRELCGMVARGEMEVRDGD